MASTMLYNGSRFTDKFKVKGSSFFNAFKEIVKAKLVQTSPSNNKYNRFKGFGMEKLVALKLRYIGSSKVKIKNPDASS